MLIGVACLAMPEMLVEIEVGAIIETNRLRLPKGAVSRQRGILLVTPESDPMDSCDRI